MPFDPITFAYCLVTAVIAVAGIFASSRLAGRLASGYTLAGLTVAWVAFVLSVFIAGLPLAL